MTEYTLDFINVIQKGIGQPGGSTSDDRICFQPQLSKRQLGCGIELTYMSPLCLGFQLCCNYTNMDNVKMF